VTRERGNTALILGLGSRCDLSGQRHAPTALYHRARTPATKWTGGWVGLRAGLDTVARRKSFASARDRNTFVKSVVTILYYTILTEQCQLLDTVLRTAVNGERINREFVDWKQLNCK
jgi:hypothetical protein